MNVESPQPIRPLRSEADYDAALAEFETYFDHEPEPGTPEGDRFELLGMVIAKYEDEHHQTAPADPVEAIRLVMEGRGYTQVDLARLLGSRSRASEVLSGRRELTLNQIRRLNAEWGIPGQVLIGGARAA